MARESNEKRIADENPKTMSRAKGSGGKSGNTIRDISGPSLKGDQVSHKESGHWHHQGTAPYHDKER